MSPNLARFRAVQHGWIAEEETTCSSNKYNTQTVNTQFQVSLYCKQLEIKASYSDSLDGAPTYQS